MDLFLDGTPGSHVFPDEEKEVGVAIEDLDLAAGLAGGFAWPGCLPCWAVAVQSAAGGGDPLAQPVAASAKSRCHPIGPEGVPSELYALSQWVCRAESSQTSSSWRCQYGGTTVGGSP